MKDRSLWERLRCSALPLREGVGAPAVQIVGGMRYPTALRCFHSSRDPKAPPVNPQPNTPFPHSRRLVDRTRCGLLVVDLQPRLLAAIAGGEQIVWNAGRLLRGAELMSVSSMATAQYPQGLGPQHEDIQQLAGDAIGKREFSAGVVPEVCDWVRHNSLDQMVVCGIESHVCLGQTVMDLLAAGLDCFIPVDAVGSRRDLDHQMALRRLSDEGASLSSTEAVLFEWCRTSTHENFKAISGLVRETAPGE